MQLWSSEAVGSNPIRKQKLSSGFFRPGGIFHFCPFVVGRNCSGHYSIRDS